MSDLTDRIERMSVPEPNTSCLLWLGSTGTNGYGSTTVSGRSVSAHRASYEAHFGEIAPGKIILHKCDTKECVNPLHMTLGTHHDNAVDRAKRGRRDTTSTEQRNKWGTKGAKRGSWGLGLNLKERIDRLSSMSDSGCCIWQGTVTKSTGYGEIKINGRKTTAHRAIWFAHRGEIPVGMVIMHSCDNRLCVNMEHLSVGTYGDNSRDMARKGRGGFDRLSTEQRRERSKKAMRTMGPDGLRAKAKVMLETMGPEGRSARATARVSGMSSERKSEIALKAWTSRVNRYGSHGVKRIRSSEEHSDAIRKGWANLTPEAFVQRVQKRVDGQHAVKMNMTPEELDARKAKRSLKISEGILRAKAMRRSTTPSLRFNLLKPDMQPDVRRTNMTPEARAKRGRSIAEGWRKRNEVLQLAAPKLLLFNLLSPRVP
jgi:hypothetical protein